jgi:hypothetical protein
MLRSISSLRLDEASFFRGAGYFGRPQLPAGGLEKVTPTAVFFSRIDEQWS